MKKVLLLAILVTAYGNLFAFTTQGNWRWRKDDGSETTATWIAAQNTTPTIASTDSTLRLRIELYNDPNNHSNNSGGLLDNAYLEDSSDIPGAKWDKIFLTEGTNAFVLSGSSSYVTDLEPTTMQIVGQNLTFTPGKIILAHDSLPPQTIKKSNKTEYEWAIKPTANMLAGRTYYFRLDAANYPLGQPLPTLITAGTLAIKLSNFKITPEDKQVKLEWTTASEQYNDRFEIERSNDTRNWKVIGSVTGSGTTSLAHTYQLYDKDPLNGMNYYRIRQYDINGKSTVSEVKSLKMIIVNSALVSVFPNPVKGSINFSLKQYTGGDLYVTLTANNGKIIHSETIKAAQPGITYTLNTTTKPSAGFYVLHVKGDGLSESIKVVVQ